MAGTECEVEIEDLTEEQIEKERESVNGGGES